MADELADMRAEVRALRDITIATQRDTTHIIEKMDDFIDKTEEWKESRDERLANAEACWKLCVQRLEGETGLVAKVATLETDNNTRKGAERITNIGLTAGIAAAISVIFDFIRMRGGAP